MGNPEDDVHGFKCRLVWTGGGAQPFAYETYSREYRVDFDGKGSLSGSSAPAFRGDAGLHNPEDFLMAAVVSCHFLTYIALCAKSRIEVLAYEDAPEGTMEKVNGVVKFSSIVLHPRVTVRKGANTERAIALHERAHAHCFIANSVNFPVTAVPRIVES
ncbi:MAG: OsmC family protein [Deltaproteobacteria bacterium]|nr:OsmC family protein [Deltaproteobacteria bacterium]